MQGVQGSMGGSGPFRLLFCFECKPMDTVLDNSRHHYEILWGFGDGSQLDVNDLHGPLYTFRISCQLHPG